jgi:hypothetical protein
LVELGADFPQSLSILRSIARRVLGVMRPFNCALNVLAEFVVDSDDALCRWLLCRRL